MYLIRRYYVFSLSRNYTFFFNPALHYCVYLVFLILSQINPVRTMPKCFFNFHFIIFPPAYRFPQGPLASRLPQQIPAQTIHCSSLDFSKNIYRGVQTMTLLIMKFLAVSSSSLPSFIPSSYVQIFSSTSLS